MLRAMDALQKRKSPKPYYLSHLIRDEEVWKIRAKFGAVAVQRHHRQRHSFADVRVGSYRYDQVQEGGLGDSSSEAESYDYVALPYEGSLDGVRHGLWRLTDARYREAVDGYLNKKAQELTYLDRNRHLRSFERRDPIRRLNYRSLPAVDEDHWRRYVTSASRVPMDYPDIKDAYVEFEAQERYPTVREQRRRRTVADDAPLEHRGVPVAAVQQGRRDPLDRRRNTSPIRTTCRLLGASRAP